MILRVYGNYTKQQVQDALATKQPLLTSNDTLATINGTAVKYGSSVNIGEHAEGANTYIGGRVSLDKRTFNIAFLDTLASTGQGQQGLAIYNGIMFSLSNKGICAIYSIVGDTFTAINTFNLDTYADTNHANCASFGVEKYDVGDEFPLLYIARCFSGYRTCLVERISRTSSTLVQTIGLGTYAGDVDSSSDIQWVVGDDGYLYMFGNTKSTFNASGNKFVVAKFDLPKLSDGSNISLNLNNAHYMYYMEDYGYKPNRVLQGCCIYNNMMFLPIGYGTSASPSALIVWDMEARAIKTKIELASLTSGEIEDVSIYNGFLYARYGYGNVYKIEFC